MAWSPVLNAQCARRNGRYKFVQTDCCCSAKYAIDELGRLFAWGQNFDAECAQPKHRPTLYGDDHILFPTQIGRKSDWVKVVGAEYSAATLNSKGELWGWGNGYMSLNNPGNNAIFTQPYSGTTDGSHFWSPIRIASPYVFKDFAFGYYAMLGLTYDNKLYTWGWNNYSSVGFGFANNAAIRTPYLTGLTTDPIVSMDGDVWCMAVATADTVYVWGDNDILDILGSANVNIPNELPAIPIPVGESIQQVGVCWSNCVVLLTDGTLWAIGDVEAYAYDCTPTTSTSWIQVQHPTKITKFKLNDYSALAAIDENQVLWYAGWASYSDGRAEPNCNIGDCNYGSMALCAAEVEGGKRYIDAKLSAFQNNHTVVDHNGYLRAWGSNYAGQLGLGLTQSQYWFVCTPQLCAPAVESFSRLYDALPEIAYITGPTLGLNIPMTDAESEYQQPEKQGLEHNPCGHWHYDYETPPTEEGNCWECSLDVDADRTMLVVGSGRWWPFQIAAFTYTIGTNVWDRFYLEENTRRTYDGPGQAKKIGDFMAFYNGKVDATGTSEFVYTYSNPCMGLWVWTTGGLTYYEIPNSTYESGYRKMGLTSAGRIAILYELAGNIVCSVSEDFGVTWIDRWTYSSTNILDYQLMVSNTGTIYVARLSTAGVITMVYSTNGGVSWTTATTLTSVGTLEFALSYSGTTLLLLRRTATTITFYSYVSGWVALTMVPVEESVNIDSSGLAVVQVSDNGLFYTDNYNWHSFDEAHYPSSDYTRQGVFGSNDTGVFAYSHFNYTLTDDATTYLKMAISQNQGETWSVVSTPLSRTVQGSVVPDPCDAMFRFTPSRAWVTGVTKWPDDPNKLPMPKYGGDNDVSGC